MSDQKWLEMPYRQAGRESEVIEAKECWWCGELITGEPLVNRHGKYFCSGFCAVESRNHYKE